MSEEGEGAMSTTTLRCPHCKTPVAVVHHSGRITVLSAAQATFTAIGGEIKCILCNTVRIIQLPDEKRVA